MTEAIPDTILVPIPLPYLSLLLSYFMVRRLLSLFEPPILPHSLVLEVKQMYKIRLYKV